MSIRAGGDYCREIVQPLRDTDQKNAKKFTALKENKLFFFKVTNSSHEKKIVVFKKIDQT